MQTQPTPAERLDAIERDILYLLTDADVSQPVWSVEDLGREVENAEDARIAVRGLHHAGLIHKTSDGFVFATRAGARVVQIIGHII